MALRISLAPRGSAADRVSRGLQIALPLVGIGIVLALVGWPQTAGVSNALVAASRLVAGGYALTVFARWACVEGPHWDSFRSYLFGPGLALLVLISAVFERSISGYFAAEWQGYPAHAWLVLIAAGQQLLALISSFRDWIPILERGMLSRASPGVALVLTFALLIASGCALLKMPNATTDGISWLDALFTSASAVCVTGLIVVDTATAFTPLGQAVILLLIQLGAFGIVTLTFFLAVLSGQGFSVSSRMFLRDLLSVENMRGLSLTLAAIVVVTLCFEAVGAVALHAAWADALPNGQSWWISVFHSISAFCNAGFSTFSAGLADPRVVGRLPAQAVIMVLIVLGGIGFPVILEMVRLARRVFDGDDRRRNCRRLSTHSRLVLTLTAIFLVGGALLMWIGGGANPPGAAEGGFWEALFNSVTARTAGFNISDMSALPSASTAIIILLMFIGGSPGGIAGGIKTTTFAVALLNLRRIVFGRQDVQMFERRIEDVVTNRAFGVVLLSMLWVFCATTAVLYAQPEFTLMDTLFECVSAFGTVGLSRGITSELSAASKAVIIATMFVGRIGVLNFVLSFSAWRFRQVRLRYPRERIIIE